MVRFVCFSLLERSNIKIQQLASIKLIKVSHAHFLLLNHKIVSLCVSRCVRSASSSSHILDPASSSLTDILGKPADLRGVLQWLGSQARDSRHVTKAYLTDLISFEKCLHKFIIGFIILTALLT